MRVEASAGHLAHLGINQRRFLDSTGPAHRHRRLSRLAYTEALPDEQAHTTTGNQPPETRLHTSVTNAMTSYNN